MPPVRLDKIAYDHPGPTESWTVGLTFNHINDIGNIALIHLDGSMALPLGYEDAWKIMNDDGERQELSRLFDSPLPSSPLWSIENDSGIKFRVIRPAIKRRLGGSYSVDHHAIRVSIEGKSEYPTLDVRIEPQDPLPEHFWEAVSAKRVPAGNGYLQGPSDRVYEAMLVDSLGRIIAHRLKGFP
ncbi:MAG: hypothetical protein V1735_00590 [Nanoarchaeota archaeon]